MEPATSIGTTEPMDRPATTPGSMRSLKHSLIVAVVLASMVPFVWPLLEVEERPITPMLWGLVAASALANIVVLTYHFVVPAHPKFLMLGWRRAVLRVHIVSGTIEFAAGLTAILTHPNTTAAAIMGITALCFHVPSALAQTRIVFGARAIMRPAYLACIAVHAFCAFMLLRFPGSQYWAVGTFLVFNVYVWCRVYYFAFDKFGLFADAKYSVAILLAGLTAIPAVLGPVTMLALAAVCGIYMLLYSWLLLSSPAELAEFVRERARDSTHSSTVLALWRTEHGRDDADAARRLFERLDTDEDGRLRAEELHAAFAGHAVPLDAVRNFVAAKGSEAQLGFDEFFALVWPIREVREHAAHLEATVEARTDRDKAAYVFSRLDLDGDGFLVGFELETMLNEWALPERDTRRWLKRLDVDHDGQIGFDEFFRKMKPVWRFIYYDVVEAHHGSRQDMLVRAVTARQADAVTRDVETVLRRELVSNVAFLDGADDTFIADLAGSMVERPLAAGERLFAEGEVGDSFYIVRSGKLRVERNGERVAELGRGDWVGEGALLGSDPRSASVQVVEDAMLFEMSRAAFRFLLDEHPQMAERIGEIHEARRLVELEVGLQRQLLEHVPLLAGSSPDVIASLAACLETRRVDGVVFEEGSAGDTFFLIGTGSVSIVRGDAVIAALPEGHYFGEGALLSGRPRSATVITNGPAVLYAMSRSEFHRLLETNPTLARRIEAAHSDRVAKGQAAHA